MARVLCTIFSRQTLENRDWKTRARSHVTADSTGRPGHVGDHPGPYGPQKRRGDPQRDTRRFRPTRSGAARYERSGERKAYRAGHYGRDLTVKAGKVSLKVPKTDESLPGARYQRCMVHFGRNVLARVDPGNRDWAADALKAVWIGNGVLDCF
ncbi:transposase [Bifidobacterium longum]|jgi:transposase, mutator family|uniref:transposase n=1 Tax=Bifidobacterium longum TaxID=216816 RepID=UPI001F61E75C|nr:transposase [Bifidobacterium longum]